MSSETKKTLLLMDNCPFKDNMSGLILDQSIGFLDNQSLCAYIIQSKKENTTLPSPLLQAIPKLSTHQPSLNQLKAFIKEHQISTIWCVLNSVRCLYFLWEISKKLELPFYIQILESPEWLKRQGNFKKFFSKNLNKLFRKILNKAEGIATTSYNLMTEYQKKFKVNPVLITLGIEDKLCINVKDLKVRLQSRVESDTLTIGVLGNNPGNPVYALQAWGTLISSLDYFQWNIAGKKIKIRYIGRYIYLDAMNANIEFLGGRSIEDSIRLLSEVDLLYYPSSFEQSMAESLRFNTLPIELTYYLAAGRPILLHGPMDSEASQFLAHYGISVSLPDVTQASIFQSLTRSIWDKEIYETKADNGQKVLKDNLTISRVKDQFKQFLFNRVPETVL